MTDIIGWIIAGFLFPIGFVFWTYVLYRLIQKSLSYRLRKWAREKVL